MFKFLVIFILSLACPGQSINFDSNVNHFNDIHSVEDVAEVVGGIQDDVGVNTNTNIVHFFLYRYATQNKAEIVDATKESISTANFNSGLMTLILIHGHNENGFSPVNELIKQALFSVVDVNLIVVDWSSDSRHPYTRAAAAVTEVAARVASFIEALVTTASVVNLSEMHIVGFNLGAHIAGVAGRSSPGLARITGLDPARSQFETSHLRLQSGDARYVEVIHTDGGTFGNGLGIPIGDVDIFANGGSNQPGCLTHSCCHRRAYELFAASIVNENLLATTCSNMLIMRLNLCSGITVRIGTHDQLMKAGGIYRINTRRTFPF